MTSTVRTIATPHGDGQIITDRSRHPIATLLVNHGAGAGPASADLEALAQALPGQGVSVLRFVQPWKVAGKRVAPGAATLDAGMVAAADATRVRTPLVIGGRSAGARVAVRTAKRLGAVGALCLAFPLHPPGRPDRSRLEELEGSRVPTLVVQGERDAFGAPEEFPELQDLAVVPGADHGFSVAKRGEVTQEEALGVLVEATLEWVTREIVGNQPSRRDVVQGGSGTNR